MWIAPAATCHTLRDNMYLQNNWILPWWLPCFPSLYAIHTDAFKIKYIYSRQKPLPTCFLILLPIRVFQKFHYNYHGDCRILADGTWIWYLECRYCLTSILGRRSRPNYPSHSLRTCLHHLLLDTHQPHTMSTIWRCFIWMFCHCIKCSIYPAVIISRWRLREWF